MWSKKYRNKHARCCGCKEEAMAKDTSSCPGTPAAEGHQGEITTKVSVQFTGVFPIINPPPPPRNYSPPHYGIITMMGGGGRL